MGYFDSEFAINMLLLSINNTEIFFSENRFSKIFTNISSGC